MNRRTILIAGISALALIALAVYATFWILEQPVPSADDPGAEPTPSGAAPVGTPAGAESEALVGELTAEIQVTLYVLGSSGQSLATETREIPYEPSPQLQAKRVIELLLERSQAIPRGVRLRELFITSQGIAYVDLSNEVVANHPGGSSAEELTVFSLTSTLIANFPAIKAVKILVEGREVQTLAGHLDLTVPYGRAPLYLQPESERPESQNEAG